MAKRGKKYQDAKKLVEQRQYEPTEAFELLKKVSYSKFPGSVELHIKTGANPKYNDQMIRGTVVLPNGTGKDVKVAVFVTDDQKADATKAGADKVGNEDLLKEIQDGNIDFDVLVTTNDMMRDLAKVAKTLGPKGLMPSPKAGTVTNDISATVQEIKKGRVEFKLDKNGNLHIPLGKTDFQTEKLAENYDAFLKALEDARPTGIKGKLIKKAYVAPSMGPSVQLQA